ncbi:MAG: outer membrane lipoprotein-sorting protein [Sphingobacterium sp.]|nr:outer membrane lipoprotein-sorting protein [Sphingobacterium sp.]
MAFHFADILLAPVQVLDERFEEYYAYRLLGREKLGDFDAWVLEVEPRLTGVSRYLGGRIWLKTDDSSVLRIEWDPATFGNYENILARAEAYQAAPEVRSCTEFGVAKNGLRFPSVRRHGGGLPGRRREAFRPVPDERPLPGPQVLHRRDPSRFQEIGTGLFRSSFLYSNTPPGWLTSRAVTWPLASSRNFTRTTLATFSENSPPTSGTRS